MSSKPNYWRLCRLIHDSLSHYADSLPCLITKEIEKGLLINLSQVYTRIKQWIQESEYGSDSENESAAEPVNVVECSSLSNSHSDDLSCLTEIIGDLMAVLAVENPYIQHLTGNILVAVSELVVASGSGWDKFMHSMCFCLKITIDNALLLSNSEMIKMKPEDPQLDFAVPVMRLQLKLKSANLSTASAIVRVLRNVLKLLKKDFSDQDFKVYLDSICTVISDIMCELLNNDSVFHHGESVTCSSRSILICADSAQPKSVSIFQANLIQLFCSLLDNDYMMETGAASLNNQIVVSTISSLIPKLLPWCLGEPEKSDMHIFHYFRHKILMVLIRLSSHMKLECSVLCSWLNLLHEYFQHQLSQPITSPDSEHHDTMEGSPFWLHTLDTKRKTISPYHLQRLAVFLFLRCSFNLISMEEQSSEHCACPDSISCLTTNLETDSKNCRRRGLLELHRWLLGKLPADIFEDSVMYSERCVSFAISFLQLYMHEDDVLFEMLLQLSRVPLHLDRCILQEEVSHVAKCDMFSLISDIFNPIQMFQIFLSKIHYDHQVLLDYLISKDSGAMSAEYLLRSLRIICDSWDLFVEFPGTEKDMSHSDQKRRKVSGDSPDLDCPLSSTSVICVGTPSAEIKCRKGVPCVSRQRVTNGISFDDTKGCLFSLQSSIENLNQKSLFPYNPRVLLRRLRRFQELCQLAV